MLSFIQRQSIPGRSGRYSPIDGVNGGSGELLVEMEEGIVVEGGAVVVMVVDGDVVVVVVVVVVGAGIAGVDGL